MRRVLSFVCVVLFAGWAAIAIGQPTQPARVMSVRLIDAESHEPLRDSRVEVQIDEAKSTVAVDREGVARLELPDGPINYFRIRGVAAAHVPAERMWWNDGFDQWPPVPSIDVPMPRGQRIGGIVIDESGKAIANATLNLLFWPANRPKAEFYPALTRYPVKTDSDGRWHCDEVPAGDVLGYIDPSHSDYPLPVQVRADVNELRAGTSRIVMKLGVPLRGRVVDKNGTPIEAATIQLDPGGYPVGQSTTSNREGKFEFAHVRPDGVRILIRAAGFAPRLESINPMSNTEPVEFALLPSQVASGQLVDSAFLPMQGRIMINGIGRSGMGELWSEQTDAQGHFSIDIGDEPVFVIPIVRGCSAAEDTPQLQPGEGNVLCVMHRQQIFGTVTDEKTGEPITQGNVQFTSTGVPDDPQFSGGGNHTDIANGRFSFQHFSPPHPMMARFVVPGYEPLISSVFDKEGRARFDAKLKRAAANESIIGFVIDAAGKPVEGATVVMIDERQYARIDLRNLQARDLSGHRDVSNSDGKFSFEATDQRFVVVAFAAQGFSQLDDDTFRMSQQNKLEPWATITCNVREGDHACAKQFLIVQPSDGKPFKYGQPTFEFFAWTDENGQVTLNHVPPGQWQIARANPDNNLEIAASGAQVTIDLAAGQHADVKVGGSGRTIRGQLAIPESLSKLDPFVLHARITSRDDDDRFANFHVEKDGRFEINDVEAGPYEMQVVFTPQPKPGESPQEFAPLATAEFSFKVDAAEGAPIDLGSIEVKLAGK